VAKLTFTMESARVRKANFVPNRFFGAVGRYCGSGTVSNEHWVSDLAANVTIASNPGTFLLQGN
jgi:hypothetical protein